VASLGGSAPDDTIEGVVDTLMKVKKIVAEFYKGYAYWRKDHLEGERVGVVTTTMTNKGVSPFEDHYD